LREQGIGFGDGKLGLHAAPKHVVAYIVGAAEVQVHAAAVGADHDIVLDFDLARSFVKVNAPGAGAITAIAAHFANQVLGNDGAGRNADRVDAAHVGQHALPDVEQRIAKDQVAARGGARIAPAPADRNAGVGGVRNLVVR